MRTRNHPNRADFVGDSYELSKKAASSDADTIVFVAVKFMAETAKLLNPDKQVIIPSEFNGCSLADSITGDDVKALKKKYPDYAFICYINTNVDVKAECDVCVTSSNVFHIVSTHPNKNIYFLPDKLMAQNVINQCKEAGIEKNIKYSEGTCYVHEEYDPDMVDYMRLQYPDVEVLAHPECDQSVVEKVDFVGSTSQMINRVKETDASTCFLLTECGLTSRLQTEVPGKTFVGTCTMCKYMKSNSLDNIYASLQSPTDESVIEIPKETSDKALSCIQAMFDFVEKK